MQQETQAHLRFIAAGIVMLVAAGVIGMGTGLYDLPLPKEIDEASNLLVVFVLATFYYATSLRNWANQSYADQVTQNLTQQLNEMAFGADASKYLPWSKVRRTLFNILDTDKAYDNLSGQVRFNGLIWTSLADIRAISIIAAFLCLALALFGVTGAFMTAIGFVVAAATSLPLSNEVTKKHIRLGNEQLTLIREISGGAVKARLEALSGNAASNSGGSP